MIRVRILNAEYSKQAQAGVGGSHGGALTSFVHSFFGLWSLVCADGYSVHMSCRHTGDSLICRPIAPNPSTYLPSGVREYRNAGGVRSIAQLCSHTHTEYPHRICQCIIAQFYKHTLRKSVQRMLIVSRRRRRAVRSDEYRATNTARRTTKHRITNKQANPTTTIYRARDAQDKRQRARTHASKRRWD